MGMYILLYYFVCGVTYIKFKIELLSDKLTLEKNLLINELLVYAKSFDYFCDYD